MRFSYERPGSTQAFWRDCHGVDHTACFYGVWEPEEVVEFIAKMDRLAPPMVEAYRSSRVVFPLT